MPRSSDQSTQENVGEESAPESTQTTTDRRHTQSPTREVYIYPDTIDENNLEARLRDESPIALIGHKIGRNRYTIEDSISVSNPERPPQLNGDEVFVGILVAEDEFGRQPELTWLQHPHFVLTSRHDEIAAKFNGDGQPHLWLLDQLYPPETSLDESIETHTPTRPAPQGNSSQDQRQLEHSASLYIDIDTEIGTLQEIAPSISRKNFHFLDNSNIGVEIVFVYSQDTTEEFKVLIEYPESYPDQPPNMWITSPDIDATSVLIAESDEFGNVKADYIAPQDWDPSYNSGDAARLMQTWITHYMNSRGQDTNESTLQRYMDRAQEEISRLRNQYES